MRYGYDECIKPICLNVYGFIIAQLFLKYLRIESHEFEVINKRFRL
jgi:hypothetical protein